MVYEKDLDPFVDEDEPEKEEEEETEEVKEITDDEEGDDFTE